MYVPRVIPALLIDDDVFVKTTRYENPAYVGDPVNVIDLFNRFEVDEILLLAIRATVRSEAPPFALIEELAAECWVPLTYGGGITSVEQIRRILSIGVEKVVLGTAAATNPGLITEAATRFGQQAIVVSVDARGGPNRHTWIESGRREVARTPAQRAREAQEAGAGEILVNAIDREGTRAGFDLDLIASVTAAVAVPVIAAGGAGARSQLPDPVHLAGASAVAAGSLFLYQAANRGVLINFPERQQLEDLFSTTAGA